MTCRISSMVVLLSAFSSVAVRVDSRLKTSKSTIPVSLLIFELTFSVTYQ